MCPSIPHHTARLGRAACQCERVALCTVCCGEQSGALGWTWAGSVGFGVWPSGTFTIGLVGQLLDPMSDSIAALIPNGKQLTSTDTLALTKAVHHTERLTGRTEESKSAPEMVRA